MNYLHHHGYLILANRPPIRIDWCCFFITFMPSARRLCHYQHPITFNIEKINQRRFTFEVQGPETSLVYERSCSPMLKPVLASIMTTPAQPNIAHLAWMSSSLLRGVFLELGSNSFASEPPLFHMSKLTTVSYTHLTLPTN